MREMEWIEYDVKEAAVKDLGEIMKDLPIEVERAWRSEKGDLAYLLFLKEGFRWEPVMPEDSTEKYTLSIMPGYVQISTTLKNTGMPIFIRAFYGGEAEARGLRNRVLLFVTSDIEMVEKLTAELCGPQPST